MLSTLCVFQIPNDFAVKFTDSPRYLVQCRSICNESQEENMETGEYMGSIVIGLLESASVSIPNWQTLSPLPGSIYGNYRLTESPHMLTLAVGHLMNPITPTRSATQAQMTTEMLNKIEGPPSSSRPCPCLTISVCLLLLPERQTPIASSPSQSKVSYIESLRPRMVLHIKKINARSGAGLEMGQSAMFAV